MTGTRLPPGIIINADDLGIHPRINAGIISAYRNGLLTSATMLMTTPYVEMTVRDIVRPGVLPVGIHLSLTLGKAVASPADVPDLIDDEGYFKLSARQLMLLSFRGGDGGQLLTQLRAEVRAQLALARDWGVVPTHIDSHQHVHMRPAIYAIFEEEARRFGIDRIRVCREPLPRFAARFGLIDALRRINLPKWLLVRWLAGSVHPHLGTTDRFFGLWYSGVISAPVIEALLGSIDPEKSLEIGIHPGFPATPSELTRDEMGFATFISAPDRQAEHDLLVDAELAQLFRARRLIPRSFDGARKPGW